MVFTGKGAEEEREIVLSLELDISFISHWMQQRQQSGNLQ